MLTGPDALIARAAALARAGRVEDALDTVDTALTRDPAHLAGLSMRAALLTQARRFDDADAAFAALVAHYGGDWSARLNHGHLLKTIGRIDDAIAAYRHSIALAPGRGNGWWAIANLRPACLDSHDVTAMRAALDGARDDGDRIHLHFALGKALDRPDLHADAFAHLDAGNRLRRAEAPYDAERVSARFRVMAGVLTPELLAERETAPANGPIFILGMPRSGSSLVEQILASHPLVEGAGELHDLHAIVRSVPSRNGAAGLLDAVVALPPAERHALGTRYLDATRRHRGTDRPFFTDKMPSNWIYAGIIPLILPGARIVDVRRGAMACGFANFSQLYARGNDFAYDLADIGRFYADYVRHMDHLDRIAPGLVHRIHHENLVANPDAEVRAMLGHIGLMSEPACLRFHETRRAVHTPSTDQVRRPINRDGIDRWHAYEKWLGPLRAGLASVASPVIEA